MCEENGACICRAWYRSRWPVKEASAGLYALQGESGFQPFTSSKLPPTVWLIFLLYHATFSSSSLFCVWEPHDGAGHIWRIQDNFPIVRSTVGKFHSLSICSPPLCVRTQSQNTRVMASWWALFCQTTTHWYVFDMLVTCPNTLGPCWIRPQLNPHQPPYMMNLWSQLFPFWWPCSGFGDRSLPNVHIKNNDHAHTGKMTWHIQKYLKKKKTRVVGSSQTPPTLISSLTKKA